MMRVVLDLNVSAGAHIEGTASCAGAQPVPFSGWLALMHLLEGAECSDGDESARSPPRLRRSGTSSPWTNDPTMTGHLHRQRPTGIRGLSSRSLSGSRMEKLARFDRDRRDAPKSRLAQPLRIPELTKERRA
jgi:hypothetical protein